MSQDTSMIYIAISQPDNPLAILQIIQKAPEQCFDETGALNNNFRLVDGYWEREITQEIIEETILKAQFLNATYRTVSLEEYQELGENRDFRNAWADDGKNLYVSIQAAKVLHKDRLRADRKPLLEKLDVDVLNALAAGDKAEIEYVSVEKQRLRDITIDPRFDTAISLDDLRAIKIEG